VATHGVVLVDVGRAVLSAGSVSGFGAFGVLTVDTELEWTDGRVSATLGAGIEIWGGAATLTNVDVGGVSDGAGAIEAYGVVVANGAHLDSLMLNVHDGAGAGVLHSGASATHESPSVAMNGFAGLWAQDATALEVTNARIADNEFAGIVLFASSGVRVADSNVAAIREGVRIDGVRTVRAGDGIHAVGSSGALENLTLSANARVGVLLDLDGGTTTDLALTNVSVDATGTALGAVAQNGTVEAGWDASVTRLGDAAVNDAAFTDVLDVVGAVGPPCLPPLAGVESEGIAALIGP
jgi:hypothetical protein